jgi:ABC-type bacteriocin/lantibiotic exporter with double-glycine peptidase domain
MSIWKFYFGLYRTEFKQVVLALSLAVSNSLCILLITPLLKHGFDQCLPAGDITGLLLIGAGILGLNIVANAMNLAASYLSVAISNRVIEKFRVDLIIKLYNLPYSFHHYINLGELHNVIVRDTERVDNMSVLLLCWFIPTAFTSMGLSLVLIWANWKLFLVLTMATPLIWLTRKIVERKFRQTLNSYRAAMESYSSGILHALQFFDLTMFQTAEVLEVKQQKARIEHLRISSQYLSFWSKAYHAAHNTTLMAAQVLLMIAGGITVIQRSTTIGELIFFYVAAGMLVSCLNVLTGHRTHVIEGMTALESLAELLNTSEANHHSENLKHDWCSDISCIDLNFNYDGKPVLEKVNLKIETGQTVAIIGENGTGKSTLMKLILGFYRPQSGEIYIDHIPLNEIDINYWRQQIGVVPQEAMIFSGTIWDNLTYGKESIDPDIVITACQIATADQFIEQLPAGYQTNVGERGMLLSGGQRQRLAIARALIRQPRLLILDEPTNHLDPQAIAKLQRNLEQISNRPAILLVTHDHQILDRVDRHFCMNRGAEK